MNILEKIFRTKRPIPNNNYFNAGGLIPPAFSQSDILSSYENIGWLHAVVFRIALGCSEVEWTLFDSANQEKPKQIYKHPILSLLKQVNPFQTSNEFIALDTIYNELIGESYWAINFNALGEPAEIILPYPHRMSVVPAKEFPFVKGYVYGAGQDAVPFDVNEIIHFKYPNPLNQYHGLAPARAIGINLDAEQNADKWVNQFFYNSARPDGVISFDYNLSDEQFDKLKKQWSEKYKGVSKAHQVALLEGGGRYLQIQNSIKDMDFANLKQKNRDVILGVFGMPQSVMGISENVNKANAEAGDYTFARWIVKPRLDWKKAKLQEQLIPKFRRSENLTLGFMEVVPETIEQKRDLAESGMRAGYLTINEARKMQHLDPLPNGDVLLVPLNLIATDISKPMNPPPAPASAPAQEVPTEPNPKGKGGEGSGNFGHEGRPGEVGGSGEGGGGEGNLSHNEATSSFASEYGGSKTEHSVVYDKDGNKVFTKHGSSSKIRYTEEEYRAIKDASLVIHNHPTADSGFSDNDIQFQQDRNIQTHIAVTSTKTYSMSRMSDTKNIPKSILNNTSKETTKAYYKKLNDLGLASVRNEETTKIWRDLRATRIENLTSQYHWDYKVVE